MHGVSNVDTNWSLKRRSLDIFFSFILLNIQNEVHYWLKQMSRDRHLGILKSKALYAKYSNYCNEIKTVYFLYRKNSPNAHGYGIFITYRKAITWYLSKVLLEHQVEVSLSLDVEFAYWTIIQWLVGKTIDVQIKQEFKLTFSLKFLR